MTWSPRAALERSWGLSVRSALRLESGHTNETFRVETEQGVFAVRRSWAGKPAARLTGEARVLAAARTPRLVPTIDREPWAMDEGRAIHVFEWCDGETEPPADRRVRMASLMTALHSIHRRLAGSVVETRATHPWAWIRDRCERVAARSASRSGTLDGALGSVDVARVVDAIAPLFAIPLPSRVQWLHGDIHLGNVLWRGNDVAAIVDFDDAGVGAPLGEVAMALFALARTDADDAVFDFDEALVRHGLAAYGTDAPNASTADLERLYCGWQVLIHVEAAQRGLWSLDRGIGFWGCYRRLMGTRP